MEKWVVGMFATVDAGKSTISEALLNLCTPLRNKEAKSLALLDGTSQEKNRQITILAKTLRLQVENKTVTLLDTPGHRDFAPERRRSLKAVDCAVFVINGSEEPSLNTQIIFKELTEAKVPIIFFINKMDASIKNADAWETTLKQTFSPLAGYQQDNQETLAMTNETWLNTYLDQGELGEDILHEGIRKRLIYPILSGCALQPETLQPLKEMLFSLCVAQYPEHPFKAFAFKIAHEGKEKLTYMRIFDGTLKNKTAFQNEDKINEIRFYQGKGYVNANEAYSGDIVAVRGLNTSVPGYWLPGYSFENTQTPLFATYKVNCRETEKMYAQLNELEEDFPELNVSFDPKTRHIHINLQGELAGEVLVSMVKERYGEEISLSRPSVPYRERISESVYGIAHFDVLKHFAEITLKLEPQKEEKNTYLDMTQSNEGRFLQQQLSENPFLSLYDHELSHLKVSIINIKTSSKHTGSADLKEALKRAFYQALKKTKPVFEEPYLFFNIPQYKSLDTFYSILNQCDGEGQETPSGFKACIPLIHIDRILKEVAVQEAQYIPEKTEYKDIGNQSAFLNELGAYDENTHVSSSLFLKNNTVVSIPGDEIEAYLNIVFEPQGTSNTFINNRKVSDDELKTIWNRTYKEKPRYVEKEKKPVQMQEHAGPITFTPKKEECYLIDGYNLMHASSLSHEEKTDLINARHTILNLCCDIAGTYSAKVIVVFDAYLTEAPIESAALYDNITVIYTKKDQTADDYIQKNAPLLAKHYRLHVVSSDALIQLSVFSGEVLRCSSREFLRQYQQRKETTILPEIKPNRPLQELKNLYNKKED